MAAVIALGCAWGATAGARTERSAHTATHKRAAHKSARKRPRSTSKCPASKKPRAKAKSSAGKSGAKKPRAARSNAAKPRTSTTRTSKAKKGTRKSKSHASKTRKSHASKTRASRARCATSRKATKAKATKPNPAKPKAGKPKTKTTAKPPAAPTQHAPTGTPTTTPSGPTVPPTATPPSAPPGAPTETAPSAPAPTTTAPPTRGVTSPGATTPTTTTSTPTTTTSTTTSTSPTTGTTPTTSTTTTGSSDLTSTWEPLGEPGVGGRIDSVSVSPTDPNRILVGGDMLGVGLSTDQGQTWQATTGFSSWEVNDFTWDPQNPSEVWVGTLSGPYESTDGGKTWTSMRQGMPTGDYPYSAPIQDVLIDSSNDQHLLAFGGNQRQFVSAGTGAANFGNVYESNDGGQNWQTIANLGTNANVMSAVASPDLQTVYAAVWGAGVEKSTDGGQTWQAVDTNIPSDQQITGLAINNTDPNNVWAAMRSSSDLVNGHYQAGGIDETFDGGNSWHTEDTGLPQYSYATPGYSTSMYSVYRAPDGTLWTADQGYQGQNRFKSVDGGQHWTKAGGTVPKFYPAGPLPYAYSASSDGSFVIAGTSDSLIASTDGGSTWSDAGSTLVPTGGWHGNGFSGLLGTRVAFDVDQPGTMFLTGYDAGNVLRTLDGGASWTRPLASWDQYHGGYDVQAGGPGGQDVYAVLGQAGAFNGIAVSTDTGGAWTVKTGGTLPARNSSFSGGQGSISIASADGATAYAVLPDHKLYETTDTGQTWTQVSLSANAYSVTTSPDFSTTYVGTDKGVYSIGVGNIFNPGPTLMVSSPTNAHRLVVSQDGTLYAVGPTGTGGGLWSHTLGGWTKLVNSSYVSDVAVDPQNANHLMYVSNDNPYHTTSSATGVWTSCDGGASFRRDDDGLPMTRVFSVAFDPNQADHVVVGLDGRGYWQSQVPSCG